MLVLRSRYERSRNGGTLATMLVTTLLLVGSGCSGEPADSPEDVPIEAASSAADSSLATVVGTAPRANDGYASVIFLEPQSPYDVPEPREAVLMDQYGTQFHPRVLLARPGQPIQFRNSEDLGHNVHVVDTATAVTVFNVSTPVHGGSYTHRFERASIYEVSCDIHPSMRAFVLVSSIPSAVVADRDGSFELSGVPPGLYRLTLWTVDPSRRIERSIEIHAPRTELLVNGRP